MSKWEPTGWQCSCCKPPRQIYYRHVGKIQYVYHEQDHSRAKLGK